MRLHHGEGTRPQSYVGPKAAALATIIAAFSLSCAAHVMQPSKPAGPRAASVSSGPVAVPQRASSGSAFRSHATLLSLWERGRCSLDGGHVLTYTDVISSRTASLRLDSDAYGAHSIICSARFTVIFEEGKAIVSIGGTGVLGRSGMLGMTGQRFISANSYEVSLRPVIEEDGGIAGRCIENGTLEVTSNAGRSWSIDLADPFRGWNVY